MIERLNFKSYALAFVCVLVFNVVYTTLVHNVLLIGIYRRLGQHLFRPQSEIKTHQVTFIGSVVLSNLALTLMFLLGYGQSTLLEGAIFGALLGALLVAVTMSLYAIFPMPRLIAVCFAVTDVGSTVASGIIAAGVYRARPEGGVAITGKVDP